MDPFQIARIRILDPSQFLFFQFEDPERCRALGLSRSQIARLAKIAGRYFLCRSFVSKVQFWLPLFGSPERLLQASDWNYWLLSSDLEKVVEPNVAFLKQCGLSAGDISKLLVAAPPDP